MTALKEPLNCKVKLRIPQRNAKVIINKFVNVIFTDTKFFIP
jgi:hypothetical protein